jgi:class 3 adenylate cyclase/Tfp pilus assembly protein PilF
MADPIKMDRTWLCSVVFMDIAAYSSQSVELQMRWKQRFNGYLAEAIQDVPESERVILDTGDGAAICFLGAPEAAMFAALQLCRSFVVDEREQKPGLRARIGINLGPVKLVKDINGALNALGDGMNAGQRIMSFASVNQILVSQSFFEVVSRLSDDYKQLFQLKGVEKDKHIREHTVYYLVPPGASPDKPAATPTRRIAWVAGGVVLVALVAVGAWRFRGSQSEHATPQPAVKAAAPAPPLPDPPSTVAAKVTKAPPSSAPQPPSIDAKAAYDDGVALLDQHKAAKAAKRFDDALRASPDFVEAHVGRAQARRAMDQYESSLDDCNAIIRIKPQDPRGYNCQGFGYEYLKQYEPALRDFDKANSLNPNFSQAYADRGITYTELAQYDRALQDFNAAIRLRPGNALFYVRRAAAYKALKQYDKAIQDDTEAIRLQPDDLKAYIARATAEEAAGDAAAAAADRRHVQQARQNK